jgi:PleD family two-component response regulator
MAGAQIIVVGKSMTTELASTCQELGISHSLMTRTALIVEDRQAIYEVIREHLATRSIESLRAGSIRAAFDLLRRRDSDVIVISHYSDLMSYRELSKLLHFFSG